MGNLILMGSSKIVYKYRSWNNPFHKKVLLHNELFLSSPRFFDDPFDCRIPLDISALDSEEKKRKYLERLRLQEKFYGILSLSLRWNSILMWQQYAECHRGFCVGFYKDKLMESGLFGIGGPVVYSNKMDVDEDYENFSTGNILTETHTKSRDLRYEKEFRFTQVFDKNPLFFKRMVIIPDEYFAEIILGCEADPKTIEEISTFARRKRIRLYQAVKVPYSFSLKRRKL